MRLDIRAILERLPHRYPFLLVDRVTKLERGQRIEALKNVTINEEFFRGHFLQHPVMPGVLLLEALAQAAALLAGETLGEVPDERTMYYFGGIDAARFKRPVIPGDQLVLDVRMARRKGAVMKFRARGLVDGELIVEAELLCTRVVLDGGAT